jgi:hypothetical protein
MIIITKRSDISGKVNSMELPITMEQYQEGLEACNSGAYIQNVFPMLNSGQREFLKTGITPEEWDEIFGSEK